MQCIVVFALLLGGSIADAAVRMALTPFGARVDMANTLQLNAMISGANIPLVTWSVVGGSDNGSVDDDGLYTPPAAMPIDNHVRVCATSVEDESVTACAPIIVRIDGLIKNISELNLPITGGERPTAQSFALGQQRGHIHLVFAANGVIVYAKTTDGGSTWSTIDMSSDVFYAASQPVIYATVGGVIYVSWVDDTGTLYLRRSDDHGVTFEDPTAIDSHEGLCCPSLNVDMGERKIYVSYSYQHHTVLGLQASADEGETWSDVTVSNNAFDTWYAPTIHSNTSDLSTLMWSDGSGHTANEAVRCASDIHWQGTYSSATTPEDGESDYGPVYSRFWHVVENDDDYLLTDTDTHVVWLHNSTPGATNATVSLRYSKFDTASNSCSALQENYARIDDQIAIGELANNVYRPAITVGSDTVDSESGGTADRVAVAYYLKRNGKIYLMVRESLDGGETWERTRIMNRGSRGLSEAGDVGSATIAPTAIYDDAGRLFVLGYVDDQKVGEFRLRLWVVQ